MILQKIFLSLLSLTFLTLFLGCLEEHTDTAAKIKNDSTTATIPEDTMVKMPNDSLSVVPDSVTYLALGDSYTIGESVSEKERWSVQLTELLKKEKIRITGPDIIARTGWTTSELASAIESSGNKKKYTIVSLLIGVNNQYRGQSLSQYATEFKDLLETAIVFADGQPSKVFVLSIPDWGVSPAGEGRSVEIGYQIDRFNEVAEHECDLRNITFINITDISRRAKETPEYIASDHLHFSGSMYALWAEAALPEVKKKLN
jgi:lysophospholipase L1-like esterase